MSYHGVSNAQAGRLGATAQDDQDGAIEMFETSIADYKAAERKWALVGLIVVMAAVYDASRYDAAREKKRRA